MGIVVLSDESRKFIDQTYDSGPEQELLAAYDAERAAHAETQERLELLCEPGKATAIVRAMFDLAEQECGHKAHSSRHALTTLRAWIASAKRDLTETQERLELARRDTERLVKALTQSAGYVYAGKPCWCGTNLGYHSTPCLKLTAIHSGALRAKPEPDALRPGGSQ